MTELTHLNASGDAHMVDVGAKQETDRIAIAVGFVRLLPSTIASLRDSTVPKGDVIATARIAGIMAAKKTSELIPLCHPVPITHSTVDLHIEDEGVAISATVSVHGRTGVEMEALTAVSIAALTIYDMVKAIDRSAVIENVHLEYKAGGKSGEFKRS